MKKYLFTLVNITVSMFSYSQNWAPVSTGLTSSTSGTGDVFDMIVYNNKLVVAGAFDAAGGIASNNIAAWDGVNWSSFSTGLSHNLIYPYTFKCSGNNSYEGMVNALAVYNTELIAGGLFNDANGVALKNIAKWNGTNWSSLGIGSNGPINSLAVFNNELYVGGKFDSIGGIAATCLAKWNGSNWSSVGGSVKKMQSAIQTVTSLHVYNSALYVGGRFDTVGVIPTLNIAKWNGTGWSSLSTGIPTSNFFSGVNSLYGYNNDLYAGNYTTGLSKWNGSNWQTVGGGLTLSPATAWSMTNYLGKLFVGGDFFNSGNVQFTENISIWDGSQWSKAGADPFGGGAGIVGLNACVGSVCVFQNQLYAGGLFMLEENNTVFLNSIARFTGTVGLKENSLPLINVSVYPNPTNKHLSFKSSANYSEVEITDVLGSSKMKSATTELLDVSELNSGVYFIKLFDKDKLLIGSQKFIKE